MRIGQVFDLSVGGAAVIFVAHSANCGNTTHQWLEPSETAAYILLQIVMSPSLTVRARTVIHTHILRCGLQIYHRLRRLVTIPAIDVIAIIGVRAANAVSFVFIVLIGR